MNRDTLLLFVFLLLLVSLSSHLSTNQSTFWFDDERESVACQIYLRSTDQIDRLVRKHS